MLWLAVNTGRAAQDTATDAAAIRYIAPTQRTGANSAMQFGHALGASVFAGWILGAIARSYGLWTVGLCIAGLFLAFGAYELSKNPSLGPGNPNPDKTPDETLSPGDGRRIQRTIHAGHHVDRSSAVFV